MSNPHKLSLDERLSLEDPLDEDEARRAYKISAEQRRDARKDLISALKALAQAENHYRKGKAIAYKTVEAATAGERDTKVDSMSADDRQARDDAKSDVKAAEERLEEIDAGRQSLNRLVEWSMKIDPMGAESCLRSQPGAA